MDTSRIGAVLLYLPILLLSVIVHECAHGIVALWRGDPTAKFAGRITLNPGPHLDLYGSIILPAILLISGVGFIGWAKPVPIDTRNFHHKYDEILVACAGVTANVILGFVFALVQVGANFVPLDIGRTMFLIGSAGLTINCLLAVFNLLPIPPLDGHWVALRFLPPDLARAYAHIGFAGIIIIFVLLMIPIVNQTLIQIPMLFVRDLLLRLAGLVLGVQA